MKGNFKEKLQLIFAENKINIILIMGILGIFLLSADDFLPEKKTDSGYTDTINAYKFQLENQLENILSVVNGAGNVKVMITLEGSRENIYALEERTSVDEKLIPESDYDTAIKKETYENEIVMVNSGSDKTALVEKTLEPIVQGVVVVCQGADNIKVISDITNAVSVALNVTSNRICVIKMN